MGNLFTFGWDSVHRQGHAPEVMPIEDLREHDIGKHCWCRPFMEDEILVHNALDRREAYETGAMRLN